MKIKPTILLIIIGLLGATLASSAGQQKNQIDPNPSFERMMKSVTRIVVRDGGDICCISENETLKQKVFFEITNKEQLTEFTQNVTFEKGTTKNSCFCCGGPGLDMYAGEQRIFLSGIKHGSGLMRESTIAWFTPETKLWIKQWLLKKGLSEGQIK